jgi:hypothetical protein
VILAASEGAFGYVLISTQNDYARLYTSVLLPVAAISLNLIVSYTDLGEWGCGVLAGSKSCRISQPPFF